ncbi:NPD-domain-containing protein [Rickenella mellea]|uniref:NPD-domain-containing protein n=1 Tax=Rickenella mellea TaxID=50990 RepID=A0A4Y7PSI7_9AGAM|nr:NPD-domain-containing protein [Rickenella mellea]
MAGASGEELAAEVTRAGGFGFMYPAGVEGVEVLKSKLDKARGILGSSAIDPLRIGVGFLGWQLDQKGAKLPDFLAGVLEERVKAVWFSFGTDLKKWVDFVREYDGRRSVAHKTLVFVLINTAEQARVAINEWKADVVVAQGIEAGGHGHSGAPPLFTLLTELLQEFPSGPPILAAGGLATGSQVAALLTLGASGAVLGTRFLLTPESTYTPAQKAALVAAKSSDSTLRTLVFDDLRGTRQWPGGVDGRGLRNRAIKEVEDGMGLEEATKKMKKSTLADDADGMVVWAGTGVGVMKEIKPAGDIVRELHKDILERFKVSYESIEDP